MKKICYFSLLFLVQINLFANGTYKQEREIIYFESYKEPGSILIKTDERALYYILGTDLAYKYPIAVGKNHHQFFGIYPISRKVKWPAWRPTKNIRRENPRLPAVVKGGIRNPLGARALYLGNSPFRIHGTNNPNSIGKAASHGCIRMHNTDVKELYQMVDYGAMVYVE